MQKKITDLVEATKLTNDDFTIVETLEGTKKMRAKKIKEEVIVDLMNSQEFLNNLSLRLENTTLKLLKDDVILSEVNLAEAKL